MYQRIRDLREDRDLLQKDVAAYLKCTQVCYSNYETGKRDIPTEVLIQLAHLYHTSTDYILGLTDNSAPPIPPQSVKEKAQNHSNQRTILGFYMPPTGVEPVLCLQKGILSPSCLPISPQRRSPGLQSPAALWLEREPGITGVRKNYYNHTAIRNLVVLTFLLKSAAFMIQ